MSGNDQNYGMAAAATPLNVTGNQNVTGIITAIDAAQPTVQLSTGAKIWDMRYRAGGTLFAIAETGVAEWFTIFNGTGLATLSGALTVSGIASLNNATDASTPTTAGTKVAGGAAIVKNLIHAQGRGAGVASTVTAAGTTTLTTASKEIQTFTGATTQIVQFPAANAFGAGVAVLFTINNQSSGSLTPTRAGADTFQGGGTTDTVLAGATQRYASDGVSVWLKV